MVSKVEGTKVYNIWEAMDEKYINEEGTINYVKHSLTDSKTDLTIGFSSTTGYHDKELFQ